MVITRALTVIINQGHLIITHQHPKLRQPKVPNLDRVYVLHNLYQQKRVSTMSFCLSFVYEVEQSLLTSASILLLGLLILPDGSDCATAKFRLENFQYLFRLTEGDIYVQVSCGERGSKGLGWNRNAGIPRSMTYKSDENRRDWTGRQGICVGRAGLCVNN